MFAAGDAMKIGPAKGYGLDIMFLDQSEQRILFAFDVQNNAPAEFNR